MATLKQIRRRIRSVASTRQITKAMEMVAASKLRRAQARAQAAQPYAAEMEGALKRLAAAATDLQHPYFERRTEGRTLLFVVGSDRGLCGSFNAAITRAAEERVAELGRENVLLRPAGGRIARYFSFRGWEFPEEGTEIGDQIDLALVQRLTRRAAEHFLAGDVARVEFLHTRFVTTVRRVIASTEVLPIEAESEAAGHVPYIFEPDATTVLHELLPRYLTTRVLAVLAGSFAAEHSARMFAMGSATKNAEEMISSLRLTANKLRQAAITTELAEIVGGAASLA